MFEMMIETFRVLADILVMGVYCMMLAHIYWDTNEPDPSKPQTYGYHVYRTQANLNRKKETMILLFRLNESA